MEEMWMTSLQIIKKLLAREEISINKNDVLYQQYCNFEVEQITEQMAKALDLEIYKFNDSLYVSPAVDNEIFGYTNQELIKSLAYVKNNTELYLCYFIMYCIMTIFYKESSYYTYIEYVKLSQIYEKVNLRLISILNENVDFGSYENAEYSFKSIAEIWINLPDSKEDLEDVNTEKTGRTKLGFIKSVCNFMKSEGLLKENTEENHYVKTPRFAAIISGYYNGKENKNKILDLLERGF